MSKEDNNCSLLKEEIRRLRFDLLMVSKLAADKPLFFNPRSIAHARTIRDEVLADPEKYISPQENSQ